MDNKDPLITFFRRFAEELAKKLDEQIMREYKKENGMGRIFMEGFGHGEFEDWDSDKIKKERFFNFHHGDNPMEDDDDFKSAIKNNMDFLKEFYEKENMVLPSRIIELVCEDITHGRGDIHAMLRSGNIREYVLSLTKFHKEGWMTDFIKEIARGIK